MGWPEYTLSAMQALGFGAAVYSRDGVKIVNAAVAAAIVVGLLYAGGFYN